MVSKDNNGVFGKFLRRHWKMSVAMILGVIAVIVAVILVFLWVVSDAQATGLVPLMIGEWTVGFIVTFALHLVFWELVLVGLWAVPLALIVYFVWYKKLSSKERRAYEKDSDCCKSNDDGAISFFAGLIWLIIVWFYGFWDTPFQQWTLNDWVYSWLAAWLIILAIMGLFGGAYLIYILSRNE